MCTLFLVHSFGQVPCGLRANRYRNPFLVDIRICSAGTSAGVNIWLAKYSVSCNARNCFLLSSFSKYQVFNKLSKSDIYF